MNESEISLKLTENKIKLSEGGQFEFKFSEEVFFINTREPYQEIKDLFTFDSEFVAITDVNEGRIIGTVYPAAEETDIEISVQASDLILSKEYEEFPSSLSSGTFFLTVTEKN